MDKPIYNLRKLREIIARGSFDDLHLFCVDLGVRYDSIVGEGSSTRKAADAIVDYFDSHGRVDELVVRVRQEFPSAEWDAVITRVKTAQAQIYPSPPLSPLERARVPGPLRVFLCHSSLDKPAVRELYVRLKSEGFDPWLDNEKIKFGQDRRYEIRKAIKASDLIVVCLSKGSVTEDGFVRQEIEDVLNIADRQPLDSIFVIPLRLENCSVPERIARWHWADYFDERDNMRFLKVLHETAKEFGAARPNPWVITMPFKLEMVYVPASDFLMGSDQGKDTEAWDIETPRRLVTLEEFYIGKYPITNEQYYRYVRARQIKFDTPLFKERHPVVNVSWSDAVSFCYWLREQTGLAFRMPTELEWEKAARGTDGRIYPWGNDFDVNKLNSIESCVRDTTPVGEYSPAGDSPYSAADMAGNVWELTNSPPHDANGAESLIAQHRRMVRGGAFTVDKWNARCACRYLDQPIGFSGHDVGFRVMVFPSSAEF